MFGRIPALSHAAQDRLIEANILTYRQFAETPSAELSPLVGDEEIVEEARRQMLTMWGEDD